MAVINKLSPHISDLIAAGEVAERPASVIKELVENSIDAGARAVTVEIKNGGISYIRVADNGTGIAREDVKTAFLRHATSKISRAEELASIRTLGFRGEALAAIAAVSRIEIVTRTALEDEGTRLVLEGGVVQYEAPTGSPVGTQIVVRDLFFNTPARLKFTKTDKAEGAAVTLAVTKLALSHPEVSVRYIKDGKDEYHTPGDNASESVIYAIYGRELTLGLLKTEGSEGQIKLTGFVGDETVPRGNRGLQFFFVNGRNVVSRNMQAALEQAFGNMLPRGKFPICVLYIEMPESQVDVNVHPAKTEVKFTSDRDVFRVVKAAVTGALDYRYRNQYASLGLARGGADPELPQPHEATLTPLQPAEQTLQHTQKPQSAVHDYNAENDEALAVTESDLGAQFDVKAAGRRRETEDLHVEINRIDSGIECRDFSELLGTRRGGCGVIASAVQERLDGGTLKRHGRVCRLGESATETSRMPSTVPWPQKLEISKRLAEYEKTVPPILKPSRVESSRADFSRSEPARAELTAVPNEKQPENVQESIGGFSGSKFRIIGEFLKMFVAVECGDSLWLVDKHAAHEADVYAKLKSENARFDGQKLISPISINIGVLGAVKLMEELELMRRLGFDYTQTGAETLTVTEIPALLSLSEAESALDEICAGFKDPRDGVDALDTILKTISCKSSIKAGSNNTQHELCGLIEKVLRLEIRHCPHGRPVAHVITQSDMNKVFGR